MINSIKLVFYLLFRPLFKGFLKLVQKYKNIFVRFLVQMKTLKFSFKINWPLTFTFIVAYGHHMINHGKYIGLFFKSTHPYNFRPVWKAGHIILQHFFNTHFQKRVELDKHRLSHQFTAYKYYDSKLFATH